MLALYSKHGGVISAAFADIPLSQRGDIVWIDLLHPAREEELQVEQGLGLSLPTRGDMAQSATEQCRGRETAHGPCLHYDLRLRGAMTNVFWPGVVAIFVMYGVIFLVGVWAGRAHASSSAEGTLSELMLAGRTCTGVSSM